MINKTIYLASASPRRREILETAGLTPVIIRADADESEVSFVPGHPEEYVITLAKLKNDAAVHDNPGLCDGIILTVLLLFYHLVYYLSSYHILRLK